MTESKESPTCDELAMAAIYYVIQDMKGLEPIPENWLQFVGSIWAYKTYLAAENYEALGNCLDSFKKYAKNNGLKDDNWTYMVGIAEFLNKVWKEEDWAALEKTYKPRWIKMANTWYAAKQ